MYCVCITMSPLDWKDVESVDYRVTLLQVTNYDVADEISGIWTSDRPVLER